LYSWLSATLFTWSFGSIIIDVGSIIGIIASGGIGIKMSSILITHRIVAIARSVGKAVKRVLLSSELQNTLLSC